MQRKRIAANIFIGLTLFTAPFITQADMDTTFFGDVRGGYYASRTENRNGSVTKARDVRLRIRAGVRAGLSEKWRGNIRFAGRYSDEQEKTRFRLRDYNNARTFGESTLDMANVIYIPNDAWSITIGRMQTKFELEGVAKKSLDRNDSPNVDIDFTDGVHLLRNHVSGWQTHVILQHNPKEGTTNVTRGPLNFSDNGTRTMLFFGLENKKSKGVFVQRGVDITVIPNALLVNGSTSGPRDDYLGVVGRVALQWPLGEKNKHFLWGGEFGYAPNTSQKTALKIGGTEKADGYAWQTSFNFMNFEPGHSIGLVLAQADGGWLISPDFRENEKLTEIRYKWVISKRLRLETRVRQRKELEKRTTALQKRDAKDLYVRLTYKFK